ncbi:NAD(P)H-quinone oxidoreductase [Vulcanimicrobium alpinum]|uniref:NAD(P)H-quinone oxidoreductase n=1 Tax=Vulcanimicrobium alpinum TaxID=3016050 RepID=UPI00295E3B7E|nr:NAD(P)H-quinone oxidoreductase [Vulcanimicrobium alpinum]
MIPATTTAIAIERPGGPHVLVSKEIPLPPLGDDDVLISVAAAGVNRPDVFQRLGAYPPPPGASPIPGLEVAGTIAARGARVTEFAVGDQVCALLSGGGYAAHAVAPAAQCLPIPRGVSMVEAAALPETTFTVWVNVFERARLQRGESLLVHGGASGIGTTAIQIAKARGARVFATAGGAEKRAVCERLGAERCVDYRDEDFVAVVREATGGRGVDVVLDIVGGEYTPRNLDVLAMDGRLTQVGTMRDAHAEVNLGIVMRKRLWITGSLLRPRSVAEKGAIAQAVLAEVWPLIESGAYRPVIDTTFPLERAADAHRRIDAGDHIGKIVLTISR